MMPMSPAHYIDSLMRETDMLWKDIVVMALSIISMKLPMENFFTKKRTCSSPPSLPFTWVGCPVMLNLNERASVMSAL